MAAAPFNTEKMMLTSAQLDDYLARIGVDRPDKLDVHSLSRLHRAHLISFTWEALDAFMGWPSSIEPDMAFTKMVVGRRGGWCYEMNGLFGAALAALGFRVSRLCGCIDRPKLGDMAIGNHLTLRVDLDRPYLAEVGVADALIEPVPIVAGSISQRGFDFSISPAANGWMRLHNHPHGVARTIDFNPDHGDEAALAAMQAWLMRDPASPFTNALAVFRHTTEGYVALQNDLLRRVTAAGVHEEYITDAGHLAEVFETVFDLAIPRPQDVWERVLTVSRAKAA